MAEKTIEQRVKDIIVEQLGVNADQVTPDAKFIEDLGADSLDTVELVMALEEEFGHEIPDEQAEKLGGVFSGALGGPMEALGPMVGENLGVERAAIEVHEDGLTHSVKIGDAVDFEIEDVVPFGVETGRPAKITGIFHPAGSELTISRATRSKINAFGIQYEGKAGFSADKFAWAG